MARQINIELVDDIDGTPLGDDAQVIEFAVNGAEYTIDLSPENADKFFQAMAPYIDNAERLSPSGRRTTQRSKVEKANDSRIVRDWARNNGYTVSDRGRIPKQVFDDFAAAHANGKR